MPNLLVVGDMPTPDRFLCKIMQDVASGFSSSYCHINEFEKFAVDTSTVVVALGKKPIEILLREKVSVQNVAGMQFVAVGAGGVRVPMVAQLHPGQVERMAGMKGGAAEKTVTAWYDVWDTVQAVLQGEKSEIPEVDEVTNFDELMGRLDRVRHSGRFVCYDYETWGDVSALRPELCRDFRILTCGVKLNSVDEKAFAFPIDWDGVWESYEYEKVVDAWFDVMMGCATVAHAAKYEHKCNFRRFGMSSKLLCCTMLRDNSIDELRDHKLHRVAGRCGVRWTRYKSESDKIRKNPRDSELGALLRYNALDALATDVSFDVLSEQLRQEPKLLASAERDEVFCRNLAKLEMTGMAADNAAANELRVKYAEILPKERQRFRTLPEVQRVEKWATKAIKSQSKGAVFNVKSPPMMRRLCLHELGLPIRANKDGKIKLDKRALEPYYESVPVLGELAKLRSTEAMVTGFLNKWEKYVSPTLCIHSQYSQAKVVTGRLSSTDPPQQNIPKEHEIRRVYISRYVGGSLINGDFIQQEPKLLAGWSQDRLMIEAINSGRNLHGFVASRIFKCEYKGKETEHYDIGKRMNLGIMYGQTEHGLSAKTGISLEEATQHLREYDREFPGVASWRAERHRFAMRHGYIEDFFGGRRHLADAKSQDKWKRERALRQASNYPIQRTAAVFTLISMCAAIQRIEEERLDDCMCIVSTVHDSLVGDAAPGYEERLYGIMRWAMLVHNVSPWWCDSGCPMAVDFKVGSNLFSMKEHKDSDSWDGKRQSIVASAS